MGTSHGRGRSRLLATMVSLLMISGSMAALAEPSFGFGTPTIAFVNPSSFATAGERGIVISDAAPTAGPGCCEGASRGYHLAAWVANAPVGSSVFFSVIQRQVDIEITNTSMAADGATWETDWRIPDQLIDGPATLRAHLVLEEQQIAVDEVDVTILRLQDSTRIRYPVAAGEFGMFSPLADSLEEGKAAKRTPPIGVIDAQYFWDSETNALRAFYSTSLPGTAPVWKVCGTEFLTSPGNGLRCTLDSLADEGKVTAVAVVTNDGNLAQPWENTQNQSGDAMVIGNLYQQVPSEIGLVSAGVQQVDRAMEGAPFPCSDVETIKVVDQVGRGMAGVNVDVHATGPSDALQFDHDSTEFWTETQAPDRGVHSLEAAYDCISFPANSDPGEQGEHQRFGAADRKHVETQGNGTSDIGEFNFAMRSPVEGVTDWTAWVDEIDDGCATNDDTFVEGEPFVTGGIGWGRLGSSSPDPEPYEALVACTPPGDPVPPTEEPPGEDLERNRSIRVRLDGTPSIGAIGRFVGRIAAERPVCEQAQKVVLKMRRPGQSYRVVARTRTDEQGRFILKKRIRVPRDYRAVAPANLDCARASSQAIRLRAS